MSREKVARSEHTGTREVTTDLGEDAVAEISGALRPLLADVFALYLKTKNFHWHVRGPHFRDYHLLLDDQAEQIYAMADPIAERARKLRLQDNDADRVEADAMLTELEADNRTFVRFLRETHEVCERFGDVATTSLIEVWIDETERRAWFLAETIAAT